MIFKFFVSLFFLFATLSYAQKPTLELGIGVGSLYYPDYIGSKSSNVITLPLPYIRYRGKYFKIDEDGVYGKLFGIKNLRLDLSLSGSLPSNSEDNSLREGMPDLDFTAEVGPNLIYTIFNQGVSTLAFELPVRAALSSDFTYVDYIGVISTPQFKYTLEYPDTKWTFKLGLRFADQDYNDYFYSVAPKYITATRSAYDASGGYGGARARVGIQHKNAHWWYGAFASYVNLNGVSFEDSPLVDTKTAIYAGASVAYIFYTQN
jgi:outer membrane scaffolding protein for murein synthesis (MipA/OmpV family)